jgi:aminoglycoside phosphotransferase (APT) family kinase protein
MVAASAFSNECLVDYASMLSCLPPPGPGAAPLPDLAESGTQSKLIEHLRDAWVADIELRGVRRADGGFSSETWFAELTLSGSEDTLVLRRQAVVGPLEPYDLAREVRIMQALAGSGVPVPRIEYFCADPDVLGTPFALIERIAGDVPDYRNLPRYPPWQNAENRTAMARELLRVLARLHEVDWSGDPRLSGLLPQLPDAATPAVVARVSQILAKLRVMVGRAGVPPALVEAAAWLVDNAPARREDRVMVHGDYRVGNLIWREGEIVAVLDWEGAGIGDPLEDLGYACHPIARLQAPQLMAMLVPLPELAELHESELGRELDPVRLHYYVIYALYFHLYTLVSGMVSAVNGADLRVALGYSKMARVTAELVSNMRAFEDGNHVL